jgi:hypothetical protein
MFNSIQLIALLRLRQPLMFSTMHLQLNLM